MSNEFFFVKSVLKNSILTYHGFKFNKNMSVNEKLCGIFLSNFQLANLSSNKFPAAVEHSCKHCSCARLCIFSPLQDELFFKFVDTFNAPPPPHHLDQLFSSSKTEEKLGGGGMGGGHKH